MLPLLVLPLSFAASSSPATASSFATDESGKHTADLATDGLLRTGWAEGASGHGEGSWIEIDLGTKTKLDDIVNGVRPAGAPGMGGMKGGPRGGAPIASDGVAKALGLSAAELQTQLQSGKSLADIAKTQNVDIAKVKQAITNRDVIWLHAVSVGEVNICTQLIKALEPYNPMFIEEPCQAQNHDVMAEIARGTHLPIATGERVFTKWGFREVLEKKAATILQPDMCHAGGITEVRLIAGMAEAYYADIAPHNPLGPISLAAGVHLAASIPNFLIQEQVSLGEGYVKNPFKVKDGYLELPTGPGLGVELDDNLMADKIGHDWRNQEAYDAEDGSVVDW